MARYILSSAILGEGSSTRPGFTHKLRITKAASYAHPCLGKFDLSARQGYYDDAVEDVPGETAESMARRHGLSFCREMNVPFCDVETGEGRAFRVHSTGAVVELDAGVE